MLRVLIRNVVAVCCRFAWLVVALFVTLAVASGAYTGTHFAINTDSSQLISTQLDWRQRELTLDKAFPQRTDLIVVVIEGASPELADAAAQSLAGALKLHPERFGFVRQPDDNPFFDHNGLLFLSQQELDDRAETLIRAQPFLGSIAADPTLRGLVTTLAFIARGVGEGQAKLEDFSHQLELVSEGFEAVLAGRPARLSWSEAMTGQVPAARQLRRFIYVKPVLDYGALQPGAAATQAIRDIAANLKLDQPHGITIRLTGPVPMADEEFATIAEGAALNTTVTVLLVLLVAWLALRSARIILAVILTLLVGLAATAAVGLWLVGALNLISVAFAVLFIGIGIDFGIQFGVRYRAERHRLGDLKPALHAAASEAAIPLALAAAATAAGFFSFLPTDYQGVSELGVIAGSGMLIAFFTNITLLPALLTILKPPGETAAIGYPWLVPVDRVLAWARMPILFCTGPWRRRGITAAAQREFRFQSAQSAQCQRRIGGDLPRAHARPHYHRQ